MKELLRPHADPNHIIKVPELREYDAGKWLGLVVKRH